MDYGAKCCATGSVLGPVLFLCYINNMPKMITFDDICMPMTQNCLEELITNDLDRTALQKAMDQLSLWSQQLQLQFNVDKCKIIHIGGSRNLQATYVNHHSNNK